MEVGIVGSIQGRSSQSPAEIWAAKLAEKLDQMRTSAPPHPTLSPNVMASAAYSPVVVAHAASFQLYTQSGSLSALSNGAYASAHKGVSHHPEDIKAVDSVEGSTVSTLA